MSTFVTDELLARNILSILGVDRIYELKGNTSVKKDRIYRYNEKFYKCKRSGIESTPTTGAFTQISITQISAVEPETNKWRPIRKGEKISVQWNKIAIWATDTLIIYDKKELEALGMLDGRDIKVYESDNGNGYAIHGYIRLSSNWISISDQYITYIWVC